MRNKHAGILLLGLLTLLPSACTRRQAEAPDAPAPTAETLRLKETTVRNVTAHPIGYRIYPAGKPEAAESREIAPGAVDRFRTAAALEIEFNTGAKDAQPVVDRMLELAAVTGRDVLFDIGCGDGRIVITAARRYGTRGVGIDIDKDMIKASERNAAAAGVERQVKFIGMDATKADISEATVVSLYLLPESNALMRPILETQLRPKSRVVCHNYEIPGWEEKKAQTETVEDENGEKHYIYLYIR
ncbi:MAG: hypothetical protein H6P95_1598 [Candidatus Aminicenantes bacterium]|nr:hypothetical protein [Candidatus Aminicenantes bacterium]